MHMREAILSAALTKAGGVTALARAIGIKPQAISQWRRVPADRVGDVAVATGIPAADLRPDLAETFAVTLPTSAQAPAG